MKAKKKKRNSAVVSVLVVLISLVVGFEYQNHIREFLTPFGSFLASFRNLFK